MLCIISVFPKLLYSYEELKLDVKLSTELTGSLRTSSVSILFVHSICWYSSMQVYQII